MLPFPALAISAALFTYTTSSYLPIPLPSIDIMDAVANSTLIPPISKMDTASVPYLNASVILLPSTPPAGSSAAIITISIAVSALTAEIKSIYYPPLN